MEAEVAMDWATVEGGLSLAVMEVGVDWVVTALEVVEKQQKRDSMVVRQEMAR